ncbi:MAG: tRNA pseudouridine(55) synthase TruB, partial [Azoarcus sp.]|nr:tRNA pseudouridine(55) synthase TruB [Azoarcus sp.]
VDGVLLLDKPAGMTSNAALQGARRLMNARKAGHAGTLDPMASGLLPLTFGEATKFTQMLLDADKVYEAGVRLGIATDSGDAEGKVLATRPVAVDEAGLRRTLARFTGEIEQIPPMYSALKRDGKPLYEYARAGIAIERAPRRVTISELTLLAFEGERFVLRVACGKGTYIRALAMDIGVALGCGAHLDALRRIRVGAFDLAASVTLDAMETLLPAQRDALLAPVDTLATAFPRLDLDDDAARQILQGQPLRSPRQNGVLSGDCVRLYGPAGFLGLGQWKEDGRLWPKRLVCTEQA